MTNRLPASDQQTLFWLQDIRSPDRVTANVTSRVKALGPIDMNRLRNALATVISRHEAFRTSLAWEGGTLMQTVHDEVAVPLDVLDLQGTPHELEDTIRGLGRRRFAETEAPLLRLTVVLTRPEETHLHFVMHHAVFDLHTKKLFQTELSRLYNGEQLPPIGAHYRDYCDSLREWRDTGPAAQQEAFWRAEVPTLAAPGPDAQSDSCDSLSGSHFFELPDALSRDIRTFCAEHGTTPFLAIGAAYQLAIARCYGESEYALGVPFTNRRTSAVRDVAGCCMNILPIRVALGPGDTYTDVVSTFRRRMLLGHRNQEFSLLRILSFARGTLYRFGYTNEDPLELDLGGCLCEPVNSPPGGSSLTLFLHFHEDPRSGAYRFRADFDPAKSDRSQVVRVAHTMISVLERVVRDPVARVAQLCAVPHTLDSIEVVVRSNPERVAVYSNGSDQLSYGDLARMVGAICGRLRQSSVRSGDRVGLCVPRSPVVVAAMLAIWYCGAAYVPIDPRLPKKKREYIIERGGCRVVITPDSLEHLVAGWDDPPVSCALPAGPHPANLPAYVMFTSGSTGNPKGVVVTHANVANFLDSMRRTPGITERDRILAVTTTSFDISVLELFGPLSAGGSLYLASEQESADPAALSRICASAGITMIQATPATWQMLLTAIPPLPRLEKILCGGEAMSRELAVALLRAGKNVWNMYGPTETTVWSTIYRVNDLPPEGSVPIGSPIANTRVAVCDQGGQRVSDGEIGEICIGGEGVTEGYYQNPELTAQKFYTAHGVRWYRTGDLGSVWQNALSFIGRADYEIKIRGFRVDPAEVQQVVESAEGVQKALAVGWKREPDDVDTVLVCYFTPVANATVSADVLRRWCEERLAWYLVPQLFICLATFPMTDNQKIDRKRLPEPAYAVYSGYPDSEPGRTHHDPIASLIGDILGTPPVNPKIPLFELGVTSLLVHRIVLEMESRLGLVITIPEFFSCSNVEDLNAFLGTRGTHASGNTAAGDRATGDRATVRRLALARRRDRQQ